jgi:2-polyprenyl-6-methoxyphenol hydroxylase-like FAD-dependent oxidoreductase
MIIEPEKTAVISGASVAGPALAFWLHRYGFRPIVVERAGAVRGGGYPIDVRGVAVDVVERMGLLPRIRAARTRTRTISVVDGAGRPVVVSKAAAFAGLAAGHDVELPRGDLTAALYESTRDDVEYVFGDSITGVDEQPDGVEVTFAQGQPRRVDLVVGADGLHSAVRRLTFGAEEQFTRHLGYYVAGFSVPNYLGMRHEAIMHNDPGLFSGLNALGDGSDLLAMFAFASPRLRFDPYDVNRQHQLLQDAFAGSTWVETPRLLEHMRKADDFYFDTIDQVRMPSWTSGRVALVGDAGYAPSQHS